MNLIRSTLDLDSRVQVMGVLNVTPDSFSDGGQFDDVNRAVDRAFEIEAEGAQIIDVGGQSTRPGSKPISAETELVRVMPVLERLSGQLRIPISIDTARSAVARAAVEWGAELINDISGLRFDPELAEVAVQTGAGLVLMHSRGTAETLHKQPAVKEILSEVVSGLRESVEKAQARGVRREKIVIDPGIGFGKTPEQSMTVLARLAELQSFGLPLLVGASRKRFISTVTPSEPHQRLGGSIAAHLLAAQNGARIIRAHDVVETIQALRVAAAIREQG